MSRLPLGQEVRPLAPIMVEQMRAVAASPRLSVLAYSGLRPGEMRIVRWAHVGERTLLVNAPKTGRRRSVRLLDALINGLAEWRRLAGEAGPDELLLPGEDGGEWKANAFEKWRERRWKHLRESVRLPRARPYDLRHSFTSLLLHEGRDVIYVARQLGHGAELTLRTYGHVISELDETPRLSAEDAVRQARRWPVAGSRGGLRRGAVPRMYLPRTCVRCGWRRFTAVAGGSPGGGRATAHACPEPDSNGRPTP